MNALAGSVRWVLDLLAWIIDTSLTLSDSLPSNMSLTDLDNLSMADLITHLHATNNISLHLLLSSTSRGFLTAICRRLAHLDFIARKAVQLATTTSSISAADLNNSNQAAPQPAALSPALKAAYMRIADLTSTATIRFKTIEDLLLSLAARIKTAYTISNPPPTSSQRNGQDPARNSQEIKMLFGGTFPESFKSVIVELFRKEGLLQGVRNEIDPAKLYFADFEILEVDEDPASLRTRKAKNRTMDFFQKTWLANPTKSSTRSRGAAGEEGDLLPGGGNTAARPATRWRRCARCAAVMEDVITTRAALQWLVMQQRRCFCGGYWDTLVPGQTVA